MTGRNKFNLLGLDKGGGKIEETNKFQVTLLSLGPVQYLSQGEKYSLLLTKAGEVWKVGGESREITKIVFPVSPKYKIELVAACDSLALFALEDGQIFSLSKREFNWANAELVDLKGLPETQKKPIKMETSKDLAVIHIQLI